MAKHKGGGLPPGTKAPVSAQYQNTTTRGEITGVKGKPLPPTGGPGQRYVVADITKHKR